MNKPNSNVSSFRPFIMHSDIHTRGGWANPRYRSCFDRIQPSPEQPFFVFECVRKRRESNAVHNLCSPGLDEVTQRLPFHIQVRAVSSGHERAVSWTRARVLLISDWSTGGEGSTTGWDIWSTLLLSLFDNDRKGCTGQTHKHQCAAGHQHCCESRTVLSTQSL